ncbi:helix-turn-helix domain-containing protein [Mesorhizobium sp. M0166]
MLGWSQGELAAAAGVSRATIVDFERGARIPHRNNLDAIRSALEAAGVEFIPENGSGPGVRLARRSNNG